MPLPLPLPLVALAGPAVAVGFLMPTAATAADESAEAAHDSMDEPAAPTRAGAPLLACTGTRLYG